jgi:hypothetical protein
MNTPLQAEGSPLEMRKKLERMMTQISSLCCLLGSEIKSDGSSKLLDPLWNIYMYIYIYIHLTAMYL